MKYSEILFATTKKLSENFNCDVIVEDAEGIFENECFYVSIVPMSIQASTRITDEKRLMISIKYFGGNKVKCYDMSNDLNDLFNRTLKVNDKFLNISNTEPNIFNDEVGVVLDFLVYITYFDDIKQDLDEFDIMQDLKINNKLEY